VTVIRGVISDFGGVLTSPLLDAFAALQGPEGVPLDALGRAMATTAEARGAHPLFELEKGRISEADFLSDLQRGLEAELGRPVELTSLGQAFFEHLEPNDEMFAFYRDLRDRGLHMALLTNNVREWEPLWRSMLPVDEVFNVVVDSGFVGMRKPEPEIYELTLERIGLPAEACVFVDDQDLNCEAARQLGITPVQFRTTEQAIAELEAVLG